MRKSLHLLVPLFMLAAAVALKISEPSIIVQARLLVFDTFQRIKPREYRPVPVRIIDLDDESLRRYGQWPWPRTLLARMIDRLTELGVAAIAFDAVFAEPDRTSPSRILPLWPDSPEVEALRKKGAALPDHDRIFADSIRRSNVVAGFVLTDGDLARKPRKTATFAFAGDDPKPFIPNFSGAVVNIPEIEEAANGNGSFNSLPELDGIVRRVPLILRIGDDLYPSLVAEALRIAQGAKTYVVKSSGASGEVSFGAQTGVNHIKIGQFVAPTDANGRIWIYYTDAAPERVVPVWKLFEPDFDPAPIAGNIVFFGTSAAGLKDLRATPLNPVAAGVEIHAQALEQIILQDFLYRPDWAVAAEVFYMILLGLALLVMLLHLGAVWCALLGILSIGGAAAASWYAFDAFHWLLDPLYPSLVAFLVFLAESVILFLRTEAEKREVRGAFSRYLSPDLVEELAGHPERLTLGGEIRQMTLLFCDIRGFTTISERFDAQGLTRFINQFLTPMTEVILEWRGTIDKYIGDCIMAFWNAPLNDPEHAEHGCRAALAMCERLDRLNEEWRMQAESEGRTFEPIRMGIGLNTGECCVGNMGSDQRFDYSVLGDDVNLASRLEGQTKTYGLPVIIGETTRNETPHLAAIEIDLIRVKGKRRPVRIFSLLGDETLASSEEFRELARCHDLFLETYRGQKWDDAEELLVRCRELSDGRLAPLYELYEARIRTFREAPPGPDWDGVFVATTK